jgi:hypothetical protein
MNLSNDKINDKNDKINDKINDKNDKINDKNDKINDKNDIIYNNPISNSNKTNTTGEYDKIIIRFIMFDIGTAVLAVLFYIISNYVDDGYKSGLLFASFIFILPTVITIFILGGRL